MLTKLQHWLTTGFAAALVMFCGVSWLTYRNTKELIQANENVVKTHRILEQVVQLRFLLDEAESSSRGFALSGRPDYLQPYQNARAQMDVAVQILDHDLLERPAQRQALDEVKPLFSERLSLMEELIATRSKGGTDAAIRVVQTDRGKTLTEEITKRLLRLQIEEQNLLLESSTASDRKTRVAAYSVILGSATGLLLLAVALAFIRRSIRQRETLQAALASTERMQRAILDGANYSIISTDQNGLVRTVNATAQKWLKYEPLQLAGKNITMLHDRQELVSRAVQLGKSMGERLAPDFEVLTAKARHGVADQAEWTYLRSDGTTFPVSASVTALRNEAGLVTGYLVIANDLTGRREIERMKDEFVWMVSHELRTPVTAIKGALGLVAGGALGGLPDRASEMLKIALRNTDRLARLISDILDLARIESGRMHLVKKRTDSRELMQHAVESVQSLAAEAGLTITLHTVSVVIDVDPDRLIQAFTNLLGNAAKFSPPGGEVVFGSTVENEAIVFHVRDRGRGIPKEKLETIFERFEQVDPSDARDRGGSGLGLAICRSIIHQHGGRIWAESETGKGSTFFVRLPIGYHPAGG